MDAVELTADDVRRARHGYYAALSYVDERVGEVVAAFEACGLLEDTVVVLTSDHGDFLGEFGLFFKMSFREHAARVPLIVHAPGSLFRPACARAGVARRRAADARRSRAARPLRRACARVDGRTLVPLLEGAAEDAEATALGEYLAECVPAPMVMIRRGRWKFVHMPGDPDQLFDLDADPLELSNLAADDARADVVGAFREETRRRWDLEALARDVRASQLARLTVFDALNRGRPYAWDFQPSRIAAEQYTRNTMDVAERDLRSRFPPADSG